MADAYTTFAQMANDAPNVFIAMKMIELSERRTILRKVCEPFPLENHMSKTLRAVRVKRVALPTAELVEGVTPQTNALELEYVDVTVKQWGIVVLLTDVVQLTVKHPMLNLAIERVAMVMNELEEREASQVLMTGTNVSYPGSVTARSDLTNVDLFNTQLMINIVAQLKMRGAPTTSDGYYMGFMQPVHTAAVLGSDQTFQNASAFSRYANLQYGYMGPWMGVDWSEGNFLPILVGVPAPTTAAATATKAQYAVGTSGSLATGNYQLKVIAREVLTDYERRFSVQSANIAVTLPGSISVTLPSSTNYTYDIYLTAVGGTTAYKVASRRAAGSTYTITTAPAGTEAVAPVSPADGVSVFPGWVFGRSAFGICTLNGMSLQTFLTPYGASDSDPLAQRRKVGAKYMQHFFILDNNHFERFETSSPLTAPLPA